MGGEGTDITVNKDKLYEDELNNTVSFSINTNVGRWIRPDCLDSDGKKFLEYLKKADIVPTVKMQNDMVFVDITVQKKRAVAARLKDALHQAKVDDIRNYSMKIMGGETDQSRKDIVIDVSRQMLRQVKAPACVQEYKNLG